jgi:hypothetical protein
VNQPIHSEKKRIKKPSNPFQSKNRLDQVKATLPQKNPKRLVVVAKI